MSLHVSLLNSREQTLCHLDPFSMFPHLKKKKQKHRVEQCGVFYMVVAGCKQSIPQTAWTKCVLHLSHLQDTKTSSLNSARTRHHKRLFAKLPIKKVKSQQQLTDCATLQKKKCGGTKELWAVQQTDVSPRIHPKNSANLNPLQRGCWMREVCSNCGGDRQEPYHGLQRSMPKAQTR